MKPQADDFSWNFTLFPFLLSFQLLLIAVGIWNHPTAINPDAVAYLRIAKYYVDGNMALAVSGYWGPFLSWLIAGFLSVGIDHILAGKLATGLSAVVFLTGAIRVFHLMLEKRSSIFIAGALTASFGTYWAVAGIGADLLVGGLLLWGVSFTITRGRCESRVRPFVAGIFYGLGYLAKSVALPVSVVLVIALEFMNSCDEGVALPGLRRIIWSLIGIVLLALPWIAVLSWHYGVLTFSRSATIGHAIVGPGVQDHYFAIAYHLPEPGRITSWEDPDPKMYEDWSALANIASFKHFLKLLAHNVKHIFDVFRSFDVIGIGFTAAVFGFLLREAKNRYQRWRLCCPVLAITAGVYLPVYAEESRYFMVCYPLLLAAAFGFVRALESIGGREDVGRPRRYPSFPQIMRIAAALVIVLSFLPQAAKAVHYALKPAEFPKYSAGAQVAEAIRNSSSGPLASVGNPEGVALAAALYGAYISGRQFLGNRILFSDDEVLSHGPCYLVVESGTTVDNELEHDPRAQRVPLPERPGTKKQVSLYFFSEHRH